MGLGEKWTRRTHEDPEERAKEPLAGCFRRKKRGESDGCWFSIYGFIFFVVGFVLVMISFFVILLVINKS